jgi:hypothetical protein
MDNGGPYSKPGSYPIPHSVPTQFLASMARPKFSPQESRKMPPFQMYLDIGISYHLQYCTVYYCISVATF